MFRSDANRSEIIVVSESEQDFLATVRALYDAALGQDDWSKALGRLSENLGGNGYNLFVLDRPSMTIPFSVSVNIPPALLAEYSTEYAQIDPGLAYFNRNPNEPFYYTYQHSDEEEIRRHPYFAFLNRMGGDPYYLAYTFDLGERRSAIATLQFSRAHGHAQAVDFDRMEQMRPHIRNCVRIQSLLQDLDLHRRTAEEALNRLPTAIFLQDKTGRVSFHNAAAEAMVRESDGVALRRGRIAFDCRAGDDRYSKALQAWRRPERVGRDAPPAAIRVARPSGRADYIAQLLPLAGSHPLIGEESRAFVTMISDPDRGVRLAGVELQALFGLTAAEARVALLLAHGAEPGAVAERLNVSGNTLKTHRKRVFEKLGVTSQSALARFLIAL